MWGGSGGGGAAAPTFFFCFLSLSGEARWPSRKPCLATRRPSTRLRHQARACVWRAAGVACIARRVLFFFACRAHFLRHRAAFPSARARAWHPPPRLAPGPRVGSGGVTGVSPARALCAHTNSRQAKVVHGYFFSSLWSETAAARPRSASLSRTRTAVGPSKKNNAADGASSLDGGRLRYPGHPGLAGQPPPTPLPTPARRPAMAGYAAGRCAGRRGGPARRGQGRRPGGGGEFSGGRAWALRG